MNVNGREFRNNPTAVVAPVPWPNPLPPEPRPLTHPRWPGFVRRVKSGELRVNPRLTDSAEQYGLHGELVWEFYLAGHEDGTAEFVARVAASVAAKDG